MITIHVESDDTDQRIDRYLRKKYPSASPWFIQKLLRTNKVKVNGERVKNGDYRILWEDSIYLYISEDIEKNISEERPWSTVENVNNDGKDVKFQVEGFESTILYEDDDILCINKPYGINVHPGDHKTKEVSLIQLAEDYIKKQTGKKWFISLVHRIDRDTSWVLLFAKNRISLNFLLEELQNHKITKLYSTICVGDFDEHIEKITAPLLRREVDAGAKVIVSPEWQKAITHIRIIEKIDWFTFLEARLETGRMHQIRVHLAHVWNPIVGDKNYGDKKSNREALLKYSVKRQLLHAKELSFTHPKSHKTITITALIPDDFKAILWK